MKRLLAVLASELCAHLEAMEKRGVFTKEQCAELTRLIAEAGELTEEEFSQRVNAVYREAGLIDSTRL